MNYTLRNIVSVAIIVFILIFGYYYLFARQEGQYIPDNWADFDCMYPTSISKDDLQPTLLKGSILILNNCITSDNTLNIGDILLFNSDGLNRIGIIKEKNIKDGLTYYVVSTSNFEEKSFTIQFEEILAYTKLPSES